MPQTPTVTLPPAPSRRNHDDDNNDGTAGSSVVLSPLRLGRYFSRREALNSGSNHRALLLNPGVNEKFVGIYSPVAVFWGILFLVVPAAYLYIGLVLLRELYRTFPEIVLMRAMELYTPWLATMLTAMNAVSRWVEIWCCLEAVFYLCLKLHIKWLQTRDPLEASLSAAPMMELPDRRVLWDRMMACEEDDPVGFLRGWFFDQALENIAKYDVRDFIAWSMFEGRHQEHLTDAELLQLEQFVDEAEQRISLQLYGEQPTDDMDDGDDDDHELDRDPADSVDRVSAIFDKVPRKRFVFSEQSIHEETNYFSDLYESYRKSYEENLNAMRRASAGFHPVKDLRNMMHDATADFQPVQNMRNLMAETGKQIEKAEESALRRASQVYGSLVPAGSQMDKQLSAMTHEVAEAWNSVRNVRESLEVARLLKKQRQRIRQQLKGYRELLKQMRSMSTAIPSKEMASMMRRITECNERMELLEQRAKTSFLQATGSALKSLPFLPHQNEPVRFAKYSSDPLLGIATYPLGFHALMFCLSEVPLRILMHRRGFERRVMGSVAYYFHPGKLSKEKEDDDDIALSRHDDDCDDDAMTPIVFVHGIGLGLLPYLPLIDALLNTGRPVLLPEIPYVSGFRPFQSPYGVLPPAVVCSTMTAMLASHGFLKATWMGHSYGTSWLSYMCKFAPRTVSALLFLDPICFCLHVPYLTKQFVYMRPDPGTVSYMVRTDVIINWTIQRSFPWTWVTLFTEQINVPCAVFLSENDALVPARKVQDYLKTKNVACRDFDQCTEQFFYSGRDGDDASTRDDMEKVDESRNGDSAAATTEKESKDEDTFSTEPMQSHPHIACALFRGDGHGDWTDRQSATVPLIVKAAEALCRRAEEATEE